jgi:hypothetical protein
MTLPDDTYDRFFALVKARHTCRGRLAVPEEDEFPSSAGPFLHDDTSSCDHVRF